MSSFTHFDTSVMVVFDPRSSKVFHKDHWRTITPFTYYVGYKGSNTSVTVPRNYITDFSSVPWFVRWLVPRHDTHGQAAVLHDYLTEYGTVSIVEGSRTSRVQVSRKDIDKIFYEACKVSGVSRRRRWVIRAGMDLYRMAVRPKVRVDPLKSALMEECNREDSVE